jgi:hypothetical protein
MSLVYVRSFKKTERTAFVTLTTMRNPKRIVEEEVSETWFLTQKRYGWFQKVENTFVDVGSVYDENTYQHPCYLTLDVRDGTLVSFGVSVHGQELEIMRRTERDLLTDLFSILRTSSFDVIVTKGVPEPEDYLRSKHSHYWGGEFWLSTREFIDVDLFCERYGKRKLANAAKKVDSNYLILPTLTEAGNFLGVSRQELLEREPKNGPVDGTNLVKVATRPFVLSVLPEAAARTASFLPQRECLEILDLDLNAKIKYSLLLQTPAVDSGDYVYYRTNSTLPEGSEIVDKIP